MTEQTHPTLLIVEDSDEDFELACWALQKAGFQRPILRCTRVDDALAALCAREGEALPPGGRPSLVLLDLNLPDGSGREVLEAVQDNPRCLPVPVVVFSSSSHTREIDACYRLGAAGYLCKPLDRRNLLDQIQAFVRYWFQAVTLPLP